MKNIPRIFVGNGVNMGDILPVSRDTSHYLTHVMRRRDFIAFGGGHEFSATISADGKNIIIGSDTGRADTSGDVELYFAPIKRTDEMINMVTQMGVAALHPVITEHTVAHNINWERMKRIAIEAAEQSNRNSVPKFFPPVNFSELDLSDISFADERAAHGANSPTRAHRKKILIGPEGGFSAAEFDALDTSGAVGFGLGKTILRAQLAAAVAVWVASN